ncbi:unnamed protein product, partial [Polarella glacialis]
VQDFPVIKEGNICIGFTTRARLQAALKSWEASGILCEGDVGNKTQILGLGNEEMTQIISGIIGRESSFSGSMLPVLRLAERSPYTVLEGMPGPRIYNLFAKAGAKSAAVVSEKGEFRGMISRNGLIEVVRRLEEAHDNRKFDDDTLDEDEEESSLVIPR